MRGEIAGFCLQMIGCLKIESVAAPPPHCEERKRRSNPFFVCGPTDCFRLRSSRYGGHVASRAMTGRVGWAKAPFAPCPPCQRKSKMAGTLALCPPYAAEGSSRRKILARPLLAGAGGVGLQRPDALGQRAAALGGGAARGRAIAGGAVGGLPPLRPHHPPPNHPPLHRRAPP